MSGAPPSSSLPSLLVRVRPEGSAPRSVPRGKPIADGVRALPPSSFHRADRRSGASGRDGFVARKGEAFVAPGRNLVAAFLVAVEAADIGHEHARLAGN